MKRTTRPTMTRGSRPGQDLAKAEEETKRKRNLQTVKEGKRKRETKLNLTGRPANYEPLRSDKKKGCPVTQEEANQTTTFIMDRMKEQFGPTAGVFRVELRHV